MNPRRKRYYHGDIIVLFLVLYLQGLANSMLSFSPFISSIFFLRIHSKDFSEQYRTKNGRNRIFQTNLKFLKISKKWQNWGFFGIFSKTNLRIFLIFFQNVELKSASQPGKTICGKKDLFRTYLRSMMHRDSLSNDPVI